MEIRSEYHNIPFPYISKSVFKKFFHCRYAFKRNVIDRVAMVQNRKMMEGTSLHYLFYKFFDLVDENTLWELDWRKDSDTRYSPVYQYFFSLLGTLLVENTTNVAVLQNIRNFCRMEENHWYYLREHIKDRKKIWYYWWLSPHFREEFIRNDTLQIFGTIDRINTEEEKLVICDYKTGKVPAALRREKGRNEYSTELPPDYCVEGNFYVLLYILFKGFNIALGEDNKYHFYYQGVEHDEIVKKYDYAFIFLGDQEGEVYIARKKTSMRSIRSIIDKLDIIRTCKEFPREPNYYRCRYCQYYLSDCKDVVPIEIFGDIYGSTRPVEKSIQFLDGSEDGSKQVDEDDDY